MVKKVRERRLSNPSQIKSLMAEQINILRANDDLDPIAKAKAIAYLANTSLSAYKEAETARRLEEIERKLEGLQE